MPVRRAKAPLDFRRRKAREDVEKTGPDRARAVLADVFVGNARQPRVVSHPLRDPTGARARAACLTHPLTRALPRPVPRSLAWPRHSHSPAKNLSFNSGAVFSS